MLTFITCFCFVAAGAAAPLAAPPDYAPYEYFSNPWDCVGLKDYPDGVRISPSGSLHLADWMTVALQRGGQPFSFAGALRWLDDGYLPIVNLRRDGVALRAFCSPVDPADSEAWSGPGTSSNYVLHVQVSNEDRKPATFSLSIPGSAAFDLAPGEAAWLAIASSAVPQPNRLKEPAFSDRALAACRAFWSDLVGKGARLSVPERKAQDAWKAAIVGNFIARDGNTLKPGEGFYDGFYLRDGAYQFYALLVAGYKGELAGSIADVLDSQKADGRFESQDGELDGNGQALWTLWAYHAFTGDRAYLERVWPAVRRSCAWIEEARRREKEPFPGILFRSKADGEFLWAGDCHIVGYDFWNLRGLGRAIDMGRALGEDVAGLAAAAADYRASIDAALKGFDYFPPSYEGKGTSWANLTALYPVPIFPADDPRVAATVERERAGFVEGTIRWCPDTGRAIHPYMSTYITQTAVIRGEEERAVEDFYHLLCHSSSTNAFPEGVYFDSRTAWSNTIPHLWAAAQYMLLLRNMLLREEGDALHVCSAVPAAWLEPGKRIELAAAPTLFGTVGVAIAREEKRLLVDLELPASDRLRQVVIHVPKALGPRDGGAATTIPPRSGRTAIEIAGAPAPGKPPKRFLDYAEEYRAEKAGRLAPVKGLLELPRLVAPESAHPVDLRAAAVTDPFTMPFAVDTKGALTFKGLATGPIVACGVPFQIIDPRQNDGRGLVVLRSTTSASHFPARVDLAAGVAGKRIFFLGQVGGWVVDLPYGREVGYYELGYADGGTARIPLLVGATIEDWRQPPAATQVCAGPAGEGWHFNVMGAELRPIELTRISFVSTMTAASPVLAAVTIER